MPTVVRLPISHYSRKVEWALSHAGVPYDAIDVWFRELADFRHANPANTVPIMEVDGQILCGSQTIVRWAHAERPEAGLYPNEEVAAWEQWADEELGPLARHDAYRTLYAHPTRYGRNPGLWLVARAARGLILTILKSYKVRRFETEDAAKRGPTLTKIADQLRATGTGYLFADHPTAADFATAALLGPLLPIRDWEYKTHPDMPLLRAFVKRVQPTSTRTKRRRATQQDHARWTAMEKVETIDLV